MSTPNGVKAYRTTKKRAMRQKRLLQAIDHGWRPTHDKKKHESITETATRVVDQLIEGRDDIGSLPIPASGKKYARMRGLRATEQGVKPAEYMRMCRDLGNAGKPIKGFKDYDEGGRSGPSESQCNPDEPLETGHVEPVNMRGKWPKGIASAGKTSGKFRFPRNWQDAMQASDTAFGLAAACLEGESPKAFLRRQMVKPEFMLHYILAQHARWLVNNSEGKRANLERANLRGANLRGVDLRSADLRDDNLAGADLTGAHLWGAYLTSANLRGANLRSADLTSAKLMSANLRGANLSYAYLEGAYLMGAYLKGVNLSGAILSGADLADANFLNANLTGVIGLADNPTRHLALNLPAEFA